MREKDVISVIVPVYNVERYLKRCVESIINQTYKKLQIILVDDCSTDKSGEICEQLAEKDDRIVVFHKNWGGLADTRNIGLVFATGEYISFVDSDDYIADTMLQEMIMSMKKYDCDIAVCGRCDVYPYRTVHRKSFCPKKIKIYEKQEILKEYFRVQYIEPAACWDKMFHYSIVQNLSFPKGKISEDIYYTYRAFEQAKKVVHIGKTMYYYCHRTDSLCGKMPIDMTELEEIYFIENIEKQLWKSKKYWILKEFYVFYMFRIINIYERVHQSAKFDRIFNKYEKQIRLKLVARFIYAVFNPYLERYYKKRFLDILFLERVLKKEKY